MFNLIFRYVSWNVGRQRRCHVPRSRLLFAHIVSSNGFMHTFTFMFILYTHLRPYRSEPMCVTVATKLTNAQNVNDKIYFLLAILVLQTHSSNRSIKYSRIT